MVQHFNSCYLIFFSARFWINSHYPKAQEAALAGY
ncbi:MAG: hypothetical protein ACD_9C00187G0006, partial [uncultured bacterium]